MKNPVRPFEFKDQRIAGEVIVEFTVGTDGKVRTARAVRSPHPALSRAAVDSILDSEFQPATRNGRPTEVTLRIPVKFDLAPD